MFKGVDIDGENMDTHIVLCRPTGKSFGEKIQPNMLPDIYISAAEWYNYPLLKFTDFDWDNR